MSKNIITLSVHVGDVAICYSNENIDEVLEILQNMMKICVNRLLFLDVSRLKTILEVVSVCGAQLEKFEKDSYGVNLTLSSDSQDVINVIKEIFSQDELVIVNEK